MIFQYFFLHHFHYISNCWIYIWHF